MTNIINFEAARISKRMIEIEEARETFESSWIFDEMHQGWQFNGDIHDVTFPESAEIIEIDFTAREQVPTRPEYM